MGSPDSLTRCRKPLQIWSIRSLGYLEFGSLDMLLTYEHKAGCSKNTTFPILVYREKKKYLAFCYFIISAKLFWFDFQSFSDAKTSQNLQLDTFNPTSVTPSGKKPLVFLQNKDLNNDAVVRLAPRVKKSFHKSKSYLWCSSKLE